MTAPSSADLLSMIASANAKCNADREQAVLRKEARAEAAYVRAQVHAAKSRFYRAIQEG